MAKNRDIPLEALRGLAAAVVVAWHALQAFHPTFPREGAWWFGAVHGTAAVIVFFVLSGYVLTHRALATGDGRPLARGAVKRWPRLAGPILASVLFSWLLFRLDLYAHVEAGARIGSTFLASFGDAHPDGPLQPGLKDAVLQGTVLTLFRGWPEDHTLNTVLWTMRYEFLGSFIAFGLGLALLQLSNASLAARMALLAVTALLIRFAEVYYVTFVLGVALALLTTARQVRIPWPAALGMVALGCWLLGYREGSPDHRWLAALYPGTLPMTYAHAGAAALLILALTGAEPLRLALSGPWAAWLGRLSFPLYLVHVPVICSAGAWTWLALQDTGFAAVGAILVSTLASVAVAAPLAAFDRHWTRGLDRISTWLLPLGGRPVLAPPPRPASGRPDWFPIGEGGAGAGWMPSLERSDRV
ncbi:acyltransferase family protein [Paracraurococcus lichenis]|uniref:Acyltransferase n=1 Tax=Paracraurococcus lichenis TaxID=3064888 RepID=A0ABT9DZC0_9PROT|nr:acyltransferase [Paracraurococcus sp. LOR1-02]MDO9709256.1 acyltransferase [Paracraurococcus sp. LOR1-02]